MKLRITIAGKTYEAEVEVLEDEEASLPAAGPEYVPPRAPVKHAAEGQSRGNPDAADGICRSPLNGVVIRVNVEAGQAVDAGQLLLVLEAMKMETQVTAPRAGVVEKVNVAAGGSVKAGQALVQLS